MLFSKNLKRLDLLSKTLKENNKPIKIAVYRNHSFEMVSSVLNVFLDFSDYKAEFLYSDYDDSFNFIKPTEDVDLSIIWIDILRYKKINIKPWICERINSLKEICKTKILLYHTGEVDLTDIEISNVVVADLNDIKKELKENIFDLTKQEYSGTRLSNRANLFVAREIGLKYIPSMLETPLKTIVVDLDNTLYKGILGEDGVKNIEPYFEFQNLLKALKDKGFMLSICSKNNEEDVLKMFEVRKDFALKIEDFAAFEINWEAKPKNIKKIAQKLNIGLDSILFIDDNIGEIEQVKMVLPKTKTIVADADTAYKLKLFPRIQKFNLSKEDFLRTTDIKANKEREAMFENLSEEEYLKNLKINLHFELNPKEKKQRIYELLNKTNQFIFSYKRYDIEEVEEILRNPKYCVVTTSMSDKLSDSGLISILVMQKKGENGVVKELVYSCRALGRNIEGKIISKSISYAKEKLDIPEAIVIECIRGERNQPAWVWLEKNCVKSVIDDIWDYKESVIDFDNIKILATDGARRFE